jgi:hypothetical protein
MVIFWYGWSLEAGLLMTSFNGLSFRIQVRESCMEFMARLSEKIG